MSESDTQAQHIDLSKLTAAEKAELLTLLEQQEQQQALAAARTSMLPFAHAIYPGFKEGPQHRIIGKLLDDIVSGKKKRIIINIAPRMGKSETCSYLFPAYFLGHFPEKKIIMATHTSSLSEDFGRRVRNLVDSEDYKQVFPATRLADDSKGAGKWSTTAGGQYFAVGVGGGIAGRGADLFMIDDPHNEQDAKTGSRDSFDKVWAWFQTGPLQRLMPNGAIIVIMCMTGDTPVRMADGSEKPLRDIRAGDVVSTYDEGELTTSRILKWQSSGVDAIYTIQTQSGRILRANERHPFLVDDNGEKRWVKLRDLTPGMGLVSLKGADVPQERRTNPVYVTPAKPERRTTGRTLKRLTTHLGTMVNGWVCRVVARVAPSLQKARDCAPHTTWPRAGLRGIDQSPTVRSGGVTYASRAATALRKLTLSTSCWDKAVFALYASSLPPRTTLGHTGTTSCASTTSTLLGAFVDSCATTATSLSDTQKQLESQLQLQSTCAFTIDRIDSITPSGREEVFDIEVERTGNFIANGVVSHNTRWSLLDLTQRLINFSTQNEGADEWEVVQLPAILPSGRSLWPAQWPVEQLLAKKAAIDPQYWNAQYMQDPTSEEGAIVKREWWKTWEKVKPPKCQYIIQAIDPAFTKTSTSDPTAHITVGVWIDEEDKDTPKIMLLNAFAERMEFPELKAVALKHYKEWEPDAFIIEAKASGWPLIFELRAMGIPVQDFTPSRGNDKITRLNSVADLFRSGMVYAPDTRWAREVIEQFAAFPSGDHDDLVDALVMALMRFRQGGFVSTTQDEKEDKMLRLPRARGFYAPV